MSVYSFGMDDEFEFLPVADVSSDFDQEGAGNHVDLGGSNNKDMPKCAKQKHTKTRPIYKRAFKATLSSSDVLTQLENAARLKPTPTLQTSGRAVLPLQDSKDIVASTTGFRPILRQTNSESNLDVHRQLLYRSPQIFLSIKRHHHEMPCYANKLSDEMILQVFQYLPKSSIVRCSKVCKRWSRLSKDEVLWKRMDLAGKHIDASSIHRIINRGVQYFRLAKTEIRSDKIDFARVAECRLKYLDLSMAACTDASILREILTRCRSLVGLSLESCDLFGDVETFSAIGRNSELKFLNMALCRNVTHTGVSYILNGCQKLIELNIAWTCLNAKAVHLACRMLPESLLRLNFSGCRNNTMLDEDLQNLIECCPSLIELDLSDCTDITGRSLQLISENLTEITVLHSSRCYAVDPMAYVSHCKKLKELNIYGTIKEDSMPVLRRALKNVLINQVTFSTVARPTVGVRRTSIWEHRTREDF